MPMPPKADLWRSGRRYRRGGGHSVSPAASRRPSSRCSMSSARVNTGFFAAEQAGDEIGGEAVEHRSLLLRLPQVASPGTAGNHDRAANRRGWLRLDGEPGPAHRFIIFLPAIASHRERELSDADGPRIARAQ